MKLEGKRIAITGVGGFIGLRMVERAIERGMTVSGVDLSQAGCARARDRGADAMLADVCDANALKEAFENADVVFHTAALVGEGGSMEHYRRINVGGTSAVLQAARTCAVKQLVHLSSVMVYGFNFPAGIDENGPLRGEGNAYCQTKLESDLLALREHGQGGVAVTVIRPGDVYGQGSVPWVQRPLELMGKGLFALAGGGCGVMNHVHVDNLLDAVFAAVERDASGRAYNITDGCETSFREYFERLAQLRGITHLRSVPKGVLLAAFSVVEGIARLTGRTPPVSREAVHFVTRPHAYSIERARRELGYAPRVTLDEGMRQLKESLDADAR